MLVYTVVIVNNITNFCFRFLPKFKTGSKNVISIKETNMRTNNQAYKNFTIQYPIERIAPMDKVLFVDIETTGFTAKNSYLYLIGSAFYQAGHWRIRQWFADKPEEEVLILKEFFAFASQYTHLIHFNGNNFDLPYLLQKCGQYELPYTFDDYEGIDIYKRVVPYKFFLHSPNCKQKTLEEPGRCMSLPTSSQHGRYERNAADSAPTCLLRLV